LTETAIAALRKYAEENASQPMSDFNNAIYNLYNEEFQNKYDQKYKTFVDEYVALIGLSYDDIDNFASTPKNASESIRPKLQCISDDFNAIYKAYDVAYGEVIAVYISIKKE